MYIYAWLAILLFSLSKLESYISENDFWTDITPHTIQ